MNDDELRARLIAAARRHPPSDRVPYAFEKRIMRHISSTAPPTLWALWAGPLWRAALSCIAITLLCGVWSLASHRRADEGAGFSQEFEAAVFAPVNQHVEDAW
jgi:hypothetical protein